MNAAPLFWSILPMSVLGGLLGLDMVSFPQVMLSRPLVSATVAGAFTGRAAAGLLVGAVLELIALETLPFGASRYAEWGTAGVVGGTIVAGYGVANPGALAVGTFAALATAVFSSRSMVWVRQWNGRDVRRMRSATDAGSAAAINSVQLRGLFMDFARGAAVTFIALAVLYPLSGHIVALWRTDAVRSRAVVTALAAMVGAGAIWTVCHRAARAGWLFVLGLLGGTALLLIR